MAKRKVNKTQFIREHFNQSPNDKPAVIVEALKGQGVRVKPGYVSLVLTKLRKESRGETGKRAAVVEGHFGLAEVRLARQLCQQMGASAAKELIDAVSDVRA